MRIVITGVTRGLGRALAERLARSGHSVSGCGRSARGPEGVSYRRVDVSDEAQVRSWAGSLDGPPDILVNNAGLANKPAPLWEVPSADFSEIVDVNLKGMFYVLRHLMPGMVRRGKGVVVNMSSGWGRSADARVAPYCATKYAVEGLTQALAAELPDGMAAVPLDPGVIDTDMLKTCFGRDEASTYPSPERWAERAAPFILALGPKDNGRSLSVPL
jgi:NAD(P)-dependent dehydrogenase (short-subunit alcohol dehydrogenase family)